jgi:Ser-tRNA(Ala) deacylase AlaX
MGGENVTHEPPAGRNGDASVPCFEREPYTCEIETELHGVGHEGERVFVLLADTILYPEGGGQPADRGWIGDARVLDVQRVHGELRHYVELFPMPPGVRGEGPAADSISGPIAVSLPAPGDAVHVRLDWPRRFDHMQQHTAQHLLTAIAADRFGWPTTAFHLGAEISDIELDVPVLDPDQIQALEEAVAAEIRAARQVTARRVPPEALATLAVRTRGLPQGHAGSVRLVAIEGIDLNTCGGTHLGSTAEIEALAILGTEPMRGGTRLHFVAGGRLRRRLAAQEVRGAELRKILGVPDEQVVAEAVARLEQVRALIRAVGRLEDALGDALVAGWAAEAAPLIQAHFADQGLPFLQSTARKLAGAAPGKSALLTAGDGRGTGAGSTAGAFVWVVGQGSGGSVRWDPAGVGERIAAILGGRGGGKGGIYQGRATRLDRVAEAAALIEALMAEG